MVKEFIDITPHRSIMCKISQTGYSVQEAISELIDNSIDARLEKENNPGFVNKAPEAKVNEEKEKLAKYEEMLNASKERLAKLKG